MLPFLVIGCITLSTLFLIVPALWKLQVVNPIAPKGRGIIDLLAIPSVTFNFFVVTVQSINIGFIYNNLQQYLSLTVSWESNIMCTKYFFYISAVDISSVI